MACQALTTGEVLYAVCAQELFAPCALSYSLASLLVFLTGAAEFFLGDWFSPSDESRKGHSIGLTLNREECLPEPVFSCYALFHAFFQVLDGEACREKVGLLLLPKACFARFPSAEFARAAGGEVATVADEGGFLKGTGMTCLCL